ncbi:hypothetical protein [Vibrio coralliirubri]|uniref:hypothetical protein n=1 Tax=Vibrio coralliirubri TaxID=1516159 RepID=UPI000638B73C|nr:hypothetical protein [Vibrio coralliirubri]CDT51713.1 hypothetical protein VCR1J2_600082 [Vibrio coralliirubri]
MTLEEIRNFAQIAQAVAVSFGAAVASFWAIYTFKALRAKSKAEAELLKLEVELEKTKKELSSKPMIKVEVTPRAVRNSDGTLLGIVMSIRVENTGNVFEFVDLNASSVLAKLYTSSAAPVLGSFARINSSAEGFALWSGECVNEEVFIRTHDEGLYIIDCSFVVSQESTDRITNEANRGEDYSLSFGSGLYFNTY